MVEFYDGVNWRIEQCCWHFILGGFYAPFRGAVRDGVEMIWELLRRIVECDCVASLCGFAASWRVILSFFSGA